MNNVFWRGKKILVTGNTGFKGSWLCLLLNQLGATVYGYALSPTTIPNLYQQLKLDQCVDGTIGDIRDLNSLKQKVTACQPDVVIHMAAQSLVIDCYENPVDAYSVNLMGTVNLLEALRHIDSVKSVIIVTTDKCYNNERGHRTPFIETDQLGGYDPYSSSKACCELATSAYYKSFFSAKNIGVASVRAGNVVGGGDFADNRLIPDVIRSIESKTKLRIRQPNAVRPWQHVLEALSGYLCLAEYLWHEPSKYSEAWNFGPGIDSIATVENVLTGLQEHFQELTDNITFADLKYSESEFLTLDSTKANERLGWQPKWHFKKTLGMVAAWYAGYLENADLLSLTRQQLQDYLVN